MLVLLLMFAVLVDVIQLLIALIPVAGWIISAVIDFIVGIIYGFWYKMLGVKYTKGVLISYLAGFVIGLIPYVDAFGWVIDVLLVYATSRTQGILTGGSSETEDPDMYEFNQHKKMNSSQYAKIDS